MPPPNAVRGVLESLRIGDPPLLRVIAAAAPALKKVLTDESASEEVTLAVLEAEGRRLAQVDAKHALEIAKRLLESPEGDEEAGEVSSLRRASVEWWRVYAWLGRLRASMRQALQVDDPAVLGSESMASPLVLDLLRDAWGWALIAFNLLAKTKPSRVHLLR